MPGTERTLVLVKPDGVQRQLVGRILARFEARGLKLVGLKLVRVDRDLAERHYAAHREKPFFTGLVDFIISGPLVALAFDGPNAIAVVRAINGATRPHEAAPGPSGATSPSRRPRTSSTRRTAPRRRPRSSPCGSRRTSCRTTSATSIAGCSPTSDQGPSGFGVTARPTRPGPAGRRGDRRRRARPARSGWAAARRPRPARRTPRSMWPGRGPRAGSRS